MLLSSELLDREKTGYYIKFQSMQYIAFSEIYQPSSLADLNSIIFKLLRTIRNFINHDKSRQLLIRKSKSKFK